MKGCKLTFNKKYAHKMSNYIPFYMWITSYMLIDCEPSLYSVAAINSVIVIMVKDKEGGDELDCGLNIFLNF